MVVVQTQTATFILRILVGLSDRCFRNIYLSQNMQYFYPSNLYLKKLLLSNHTNGNNEHQVRKWFGIITRIRPIYVWFSRYQSLRNSENTWSHIWTVKSQFIINFFPNYVNILTYLDLHSNLLWKRLRLSFMNIRGRCNACFTDLLEGYNCFSKLFN